MWNRKTTVRLKNSVQCIVYTVPFHIWVDFECTGKICCFIPTLNTLINISSSYSTPSWVSLYVRKRYLSMVSWQNIEHSGGPGGAVFGTLYLLTVKKSSTCFIFLPPWPLWDLHDLYDHNVFHDRSWLTHHSILITPCLYLTLRI